MKNILAKAASVVLLTTALVGCEVVALEGDNVKKSNEFVTKDASELTIGVSISTLNNPFFVSVKDGINSVATEEGSKVKVVDAQDDTAKQSNDIDDLIQQGVDVLLINPVDSAAIVTSVQLANSAGIPVITIDRQSDGGDVLTLVASDNVEGGKMAAAYIEQLTGKNAKVIELEGIPGASATNERGEGFDNYAKDHLNVVNSQTANFDRAEGLTVMENLLQANKGEIDAVFAQNDEMALGAIEAIKAIGKVGEIVVVGFDGTEDGLNAIKAGSMSATIAQQPEVMGELAIQAAFDYFAGKTVDKQISSPLELIK